MSKTREEIMLVIAFVLFVGGLIALFVYTRRPKTGDKLLNVINEHQKLRPPAPEPPQKMASDERRELLANALESLRGARESFEEEEVLAAVEKQMAHALIIGTLVPEMNETFMRAFRDALALDGDTDVLQELLKLRPDLKEEAFCRTMSDLYRRLAHEFRLTQPAVSKMWSGCIEVLQ